MKRNSPRRMQSLPVQQSQVPGSKPGSGCGSSSSDW
jgi:hypothetical protein